VPEGPSRRPAARAARSLLIAVVAAVPTIGVIGATASSGPVLSALESSHSSSIPMAYDRSEVSGLTGRTTAAKRAKMIAWYEAVNAHLDEQRKADRDRASRGEPRQALSQAIGTRQYWRPTTGTLTQPFHPGHDGIDIGVPVGTPVVAAADGVVTFAGEQSGYGTHVEVTHADGTVTTYSHLSKIDSAVGQAVKAGQQIAESGNTGHSTGPHLHFEVHPTKDTKTDPIAWLRAHGAW
jgi:murein DD-endopeptidase MepM/ murein hydrolase activator NlpD